VEASGARPNGDLTLEPRPTWSPASKPRGQGAGKSGVAKTAGFSHASAGRPAVRPSRPWRRTNCGPWTTCWRPGAWPWIGS